MYKYATQKCKTSDEKIYNNLQKSCMSFIKNSQRPRASPQLRLHLYNIIVFFSLSAGNSGLIGTIPGDICRRRNSGSGYLAFPRRKLFIQHICEYCIAAILSIPNYYATFPLYKRIVMQYNPLIKIKHIPVTEKRSSDRSKVLRFTAEAFAGARAMRSLCRKDGLGDHFRDPQKNKRTERK